MTDEQKPPTDAELEELEADLTWKAAEGGAQEPPIVSAALALRLVAEARRLRALQEIKHRDEPETRAVARMGGLAAAQEQEQEADEWLELAAREVWGLFADSQSDLMLIRSILRKHRDGVA